MFTGDDMSRTWLSLIFLFWGMQVSSVVFGWPGDPLLDFDKLSIAHSV